MASLKLPPFGNLATFGYYVVVPRSILLKSMKETTKKNSKR